jgi:sec-independent protein translocase protein TatC
MAEADAVSDAGLPVRLATSTSDADPPGTDPAPAPGPADPAKAAAEMTLVDHLAELRDRLVKIIIAIVLGSAIGFYFATPITGILVAPLPNTQLQFTGVGDAFMINLKIAIAVGIILAMPVILWQGWAFIAPGLTPGEQRMVRPWIPIALLFFALGVGLAYVVMPFAVQFLLQFSSQYLNPLITAGPYFDFVTTLFLVFGLIMEFPIVLYALSRVGIVTSARLASGRRIALLVILVFAAAATPGQDVVSFFALGGTMYLLYEGTILAIRRSGK